jgi:TonB-dependent starch-binding outer membrane protein SusC
LYRYKKPAADVFFGFTSNFSYGNFDFSFAGRANIGNYVYNNIQSNQAFYNRLFHSTLYLTNVHSDVTTIDFKDPQYFSDNFIQKASFLRIDHITMSYRFVNLFDKKNSITVSATVQNPVLVTDYTGLDPEIFNGIDNNIYPRSRTFLLGVNASF